MIRLSPSERRAIARALRVGHLRRNDAPIAEGGTHHTTIDSLVRKGFLRHAGAGNYVLTDKRRP